MERPLSFTENRLIEDVKSGIEKAYDAIELLSKVAPRLGRDALRDNFKLQSAAETLHDAIVVASDFMSIPALEVQPAAAAAEISVNVDIETDDEELLSFESDEAFAIIARYFRHHAGEPLAWKQLGDHLRKNNVITPGDNELSEAVLDWQEDIQEAINTNEAYPFNGRWIEFNGSWIFAEITSPTQVTTPAAPRAQATHVVEQPVTTKQPALAPIQLKEVCDISPLEDYIHSLMPASNYARYNTLRNKLIGTHDIKNEAAATDILNTMIQKGEIFSFRTNGGRHLSFDQSLAERLHIERTQRPQQSKERVTEAQFDNHAAAVSIINAFLLPRRHIEQTLTYKELSEETSYPVNIIKPVVRYLKDQGYVSMEQGTLNRGGRRSTSQQITRISLASQDLKDKLKTMSPSKILELITQQAGELRELSPASR
jgi:hypothetical protein